MRISIFTVLTISLIAAPHSMAAPKRFHWTGHSIDQNVRIFERQMTYGKTTWKVGSVIAFTLKKDAAYSSSGHADKIRQALGLTPWKKKTVGTTEFFEADWKNTAHTYRLALTPRGDQIL